MLKCEMQEIRVPTETVNDDTVIILAWNRSSGETVTAGDIIATIETSKASFDFEAPRDGFLFYRHPVGAEVAVGEVLAVITPEADFTFEPAGGIENTSSPENTAGSPPTSTTSQVRLSKSARRLAEKHHLDLSLFPSNGMVTETDVREMISQQSRPARQEAEHPIITSGQKMIILGGGGHAKICIDIIKQMKTFDLVGIVDEGLEPGSRVLGMPVIGGNEKLQLLFDQGVKLAINGVGAALNPKLRQTLYEKLKSIGFQLPNLIHPRATVEPSARLGEGNQIMAGALIGSDATIHNNCIVNTGAIVSHDCVLEDNAHIAPGAILAGAVAVGRNSLIGMGSTVYLGVRIGREAVLYNGSNVIRDVPDGALIKSGRS